MSASKHEMIMCIVNAGFSETVMEAAKSARTPCSTPFTRRQG